LCVSLSAGSAAGSSAGIVFTHVPVLGFSASEGRHAAPIKVKVGGRLVGGATIGVPMRGKIFKI